MRTLKHLAVIALFAFASMIFMNTGARAAGVLDQEAASMNKAFSAEVFDYYAGYKLPDTSVEVQRAQAITKRLSAHLDETDWQVMVYEDGQGVFPAIVLPGHRVIIHAAFMDKASDDSVAFVIAHEMGHDELGHVQARFAAMLQASVKHDPAHVPADWQALSAQQAGDVVGLEKKQEFEADAFGVTLAAKAGYAAKEGALAMFASYGDNPKDLTHPAVHERIAVVLAMP